MSIKKTIFFLGVIIFTIGNVKAFAEEFVWPKQNIENQEYVGENKAKKTMQKKVPNGTIVEFTYNDINIKPTFEGTLIKNTKEYHIEVDAGTGIITDYKESKININELNYEGAVISSQEAKEIMIKRAGGGIVEEFNYEKNEAIPIYEGKVTNGELTIKIMLDARDGKIIGIQK